ncbi:MAG: hypothetical protein ACJA2C_001205 [Marinoscillum sp.]|jgi:hypothetical protein
MFIRLAVVTIISFISFSSLLAQSTEVVQLGGPYAVKRSDLLPENLTSERSLVIISTPTVIIDNVPCIDKWKEMVLSVHPTLRKIGVDPIAYIHITDLMSGAEITAKYHSLLVLRRVENILVFTKTNNEEATNYQLMVTSYAGNGTFIKQGQDVWEETYTDINRLMLRMGRQVLRQKLVRSNFLVPESPEYLEDLPIFNGTKYENFPSRLLNQKLAVVPFSKVEIEGVKDEAALSIINQYNGEVEASNERLVEIMKSYPYKYEIVNKIKMEELYQAGFQYVLMSITSSGESAKRMLNYSTISKETHHMISSFDNNSVPVLVKTPSRALVTKYYIKQTIVNDLHTGIAWDAGLNWEEGLKNFLGNLNQTIK